MNIQVIEKSFILILRVDIDIESANYVPNQIPHLINNTIRNALNFKHYYNLTPNNDVLLLEHLAKIFML